MMRLWPFILLMLTDSACKIRQEPLPEPDVIMPPPPDGDLVEKPDDQTTAITDSIVFVIERTVCFGQCPTYKAIVYSTGHAVYSGENFVEKLGRWTAAFPVEKAAEIYQKANEIKYFELNDNYDASITDVPTTFTEIHFDGKVKRILNRWNAPDELREFEKYLDEVLDGLNWKKPDSLKH